jgi:spore maturation protein SpmA
VNSVFLFLIVSAVLVAGFTGRMEETYQSLLNAPRDAVDLVIGLVGGMVLFLGLLNVAREAGLLAWIARKLHPLMRRLFPDVPADHPAMSAMILNIAANVLGLGNAATPFGLKAMMELRKLNPKPGVASDSMSLFLAINTSSVTLMPPLGTMLVREAAGSADPLAFWIPTLIATSCSTVVAVSACLLLRRVWPPAEALVDEEPADAPADEGPDAVIPQGPEEPASATRRTLVWGVAALLLVALLLEVSRQIGDPDGSLRAVLRAWLLPLLVVFFLLVGAHGRARVYESAVAGGREGLDVAVRIVPFLVIILSAVALFRASGALDLVIAALDPITRPLGMPGEALPMALLRPLSGSGAFGVMAETLKSEGPDSFTGLLVSTFQGSTETTFYVLAIYFGAARVRAGRYTLLACLAGDVAGITAATAACHLFFR